MADQILNLLLRIRKGGSGGKEAQAELKGLTDVADGLKVPLAGITAGAAALYGVFKTTVQPTLEFASSVRDLSRAIGATPEEASKLIQAADDVGVEISALETAMTSAIRKGVRPTIDNLAQLADQYNAIQDPIERSEFLLKNFGKSGLEMGKLLEKGAAGIREMGDEAEALGQVLNQDQVQNARELEIAMDGLGDAAQAAGLAIGNTIIPTLTDAANAVILLTTWQQRINAAVEEQEDRVISTAGSYKEYVKGMEDLAKASGKVLLTQKEYNDLLEVSGAAGLDMSKTKVLMTEEEFNLSEAIQNTTTRYQDLATAQANAIPTADELRDAQSRLRGELNDLNLMIAGPVGAEMDRFNERQGELRDRSRELKDEIAELEGKRWLTPEQKDQLQGMRNDLYENNIAISNNAAAHDDATRRILFNLLSQRAAMDGLSGAEMTFLNDMALKWGLVDEATHTAITNIDTALGAVAEGNLAKASDMMTTMAGPVKDEVVKSQDELAAKFGLTAEEAIEGKFLGAVGKAETALKTEFPAAVQTTNTKIDEAHGKFGTLYNDLAGIEYIASLAAQSIGRVSSGLGGMPNATGGFSRGGGGGSQPGVKGASGLDFDVPPGYPRDSFGPIWVQSGEHVNVGPAGAAGGGGSVYVNLTIVEGPMSMTTRSHVENVLVPALERLGFARS